MGENFQFNPNGVVNFSKSELNSRLIQVLQSDAGFANLFEMQEAVLRYILKTDARGQVSDILLCAPTGSGKTLAYALPIIQTLLGKPTRKLRAIVVVPTRDLAQQVAKVFHLLTKPLDIVVAVAFGGVTVTEQSNPIASAEILVTTPGRLLHLIETEKELHLEDLKYLVLDESDRLLEDSHLGWIKTLVAKLDNKLEANNSINSHVADPRAKFTGLLALAIQPEISSKTGALFSGSSRETVRKFLVSATQTRNPKHLHGLDLRHPVYFEPTSTPKTEQTRPLEDGDIRFQVPFSLVEEAWVVRSLQDKPVGLMGILGWLDGNEESQISTSIPRGGAKLVFTKSVQAAHRLCRLLEICAFTLKRQVKILEMSGELSREQRSSVIEAIANSKNSNDNVTVELIVICSDLFSRGMDMVTVDAVINYDTPVHIQTYLHRAGRTARAGRRGVVSTLLHSKQAHHFKALVQLAERESKSIKTKDLDLNVIDEGMFEEVSKALSSLQKVLLWETLGLLEAYAPIPEYGLHELSASVETQQNQLDDMEMSFPRDHETGGEYGSQKREQLTNQYNNYTRPEDDEMLPAQGEREDFSSILVAQIGRNLLSKPYGT